MVLAFFDDDIEAENAATPKFLQDRLGSPETLFVDLTRLSSFLACSIASPLE